MLYLRTLRNTACGGERRELGEFRERWEPALWAEALSDVGRRIRVSEILSRGTWPLDDLCDGMSAPSATNTARFDGLNNGTTRSRG